MKKRPFSKSKCKKMSFTISLKIIKGSAKKLNTFYEEILRYVHFPQIIILYVYFLFYLSICPFSIFFSLYLIIMNRLYILVNRLHTMINKLFTIINQFYIFVSNLYIIMNKLFIRKRAFLLIVSKVNMKLMKT